MKLGLTAAALIAAAALAGCTSSSGNPVTLVPSVSLTHMIVLNEDAAGKATSVSDRSILPEIMTVLEYKDGSQRTATSAWVAGFLPGGSSIPPLEGLEPDPSAPLNPMRTVFSNDGFLEQVGEGSGFALGRYSVRNRTRDKLFVGYRVAGDMTLAPSMPTGGTATYQGVAHALIFGSATGARDVSGRSSLTANFEPGNASVRGRLDQLKAGGQPVGYEIVLNPAAIDVNNFLGGGMAVERDGGGATGAVVYSGDWQGVFYGSGASAAAGTFTLGAVGVPLPGSGTEDIQGVGGFGASR
jgi:hypothetical protein